MRGGLAALLVTLLMAGCVNTPTTELDAASAPVVQPPIATSIVCPAGDSFTRAPGVCVTTLADPTRSLQEPELTISPVDDDLMAIGVNAGNLADLDLDPAALDPSPMRADVYLTTDGGATWAHLRPPVPLVERGRVMSGDTNPLLDANGTLHVSALSITPAMGGVAQTAYYTSSTDLGATWSAPVILGEGGDDDRNWNTLAPDGTVIIAWQRYAAGTTELAWTRDAGATFERLTIEDCRTTSPVVFDGEVPFLACRGETLDLYAVDLAAASATRIGPTPLEGYFSLLARGADGALWIAANTNEGALLASSRDHGVTWSKPIALADEIGAKRATLRWLAADPWGNAHVMLEQMPELCVLGGVYRLACATETMNDGAVFHGTFTRDGTLAASTRLTPTGTRVPPSLGPPAFDDFHALAFTSDHGVMVWTFERGLDITRIEPASASLE